VRGSERPFGGLQLVLSGDFLQLPPVSRRGQVARQLCFQAACWARCVPVCVTLGQNFRQQGDQTFIKMLNELRLGVCSKETASILARADGKEGADDGILPTRLFTHKHSIDKVNAAGLAALGGAAESVCYRAVDTTHADWQQRQLQECCSAREKLELKVGAQVILLKTLNPAKGLVRVAAPDWCIVHILYVRVV
jgi:ATP-dependent DNA helicase PIF1